jgi:hypothetical protein
MRLTPPGARDPWLFALSNKLSTMNSSGKHFPKPTSAQYVNSGRSLPPIPPTGGNTSVRTAHEIGDESATPELQAESSNLSYSPRDDRDESDRSDGASSSSSIRLEMCSVQLATTFTTDDLLPQDHSTSPQPPNEDLDLLEFLAELSPKASPKPKVTPLLPTVHEIPPGAPQTRQSHARSRFASQRTKKSPGLTALRLSLPATEETSTTSSQESSSPKFVPSSPRPSTTNSTSRVGYLQRTPRSPEGAKAHHHSESRDGEKSGGADTPELPLIARPSARRKLDKTATRRDMPRVMEAIKPADEVKQLLEDLDELGRLADEVFAITSAGPLSTSSMQEPLNPEKPSVKD